MPPAVPTPQIRVQMITLMGDMAMIGRKAAPIQVGDRFVRNGDLFGKTWEVSRVWEPVLGIPHVRLVSVERWSETRIISVATLAGREFYSPYEAPPPA